jgi:hypothetical protein
MSRRSEQKKRFLERIDNPEKNWKFSAADASERGHWDEYMKAYAEMIRHTAAPHAPWYVVPADNKRAQGGIAEAFLQALPRLLIYILIAAAAITALLGTLDRHRRHPGRGDGQRHHRLHPGRQGRAGAGRHPQDALAARPRRRDGEWMEIEADKVVPGDIVRLRSGDRVPADCG